MTDYNDLYRYLTDGVSSDERKMYTDYSRRLKTRLESLFKRRLVVETLGSTRPDPYIRISLAEANSIIPNDFRSTLCEKLEYSPDDVNNITYANVSERSISLKYSEWKKIFTDLE